MVYKLFRNKNYMKMIENAANGENWMFRNLFAEVDNKEEDILKNGQISCAVFVSSILYLNQLIKGLHATVEKTVADMLSSEWVEIKDPKIGAVLVWDKKFSEDGKEHKHIGFYIGGDQAISNNSSTGFPGKHHYTYNDSRKIEKILWHNNLED